MEAPTPSPKASPKWSSNTKLIVGLTMVAILAIFLVRFRLIIGPLILAVVLAFLLHPLATLFNQKLKLPWRLCVGLVFLILIFVLAGISVLAGFAIVQQIQNLIAAVQRFITQLPQIVAGLSTRVYHIGPFELDLSRFDLTTATNQLLSSAQAILGQVGSLVSTVATSTISTLSYVIFILLVAYFLLAEGGQVRENILRINIPGYDRDIKRLGNELTRIWEAYVRSQFAIVILTILVYYLLLSILGMRFALGLAVMAGLARFVPYIGPLIVWTTTALVAYFQPVNYLNLQPWAYTVLVVSLAWVTDQYIDQYIQPRLMGSSLGVHPGAILVAALIAYQWLGIIGLVLAAPVLATAALLFRYALRKMFDLEPWPEVEHDIRIQMPQERLLYRMRAWWRYITRR